MNDHTFEVQFVAAVCVRASDEKIAHEVARSVVTPPSEDEIRLANEINAAFGENATITGVDFALEKRVPLRAVDGNAVKPSSLNSRRPR